MLLPNAEVETGPCVCANAPNGDWDVEGEVVAEGFAEVVVDEAPMTAKGDADPDMAAKLEDLNADVEL